jgi:hypothetical protein
MIKSYVLTISEIDDAEFALEEFENELKKIELLKNSVGIVSVSTDYFDSGVYDAVASAAPFPLIGMSAYTQNAQGNVSVYLFSILVLTSDDCEFAHGFSEEILPGSDVTGLTRKLTENLTGGLNSKAKLAFLYAPFLPYQFSFNYLKDIEAFDETLPVFGSLASCEVAKVVTDSRTVYGGQVFENRLVMLCVAGNLTPEFYIGAITKDAIIIPNIGEVTAANDNIVTEINNVKVKEVFERIGFKDGIYKDTGSITLSMLVEERDNGGNIVSSAVRGMLELNDEHAVFGGRVPEKSSLSGVISTKEVITETAREVLTRIKTEHRDKTIILYSCLGRKIALIDEPLLEFKLIGDELAGSDFNYIATTSGGELCPTSVTAKKAYNSEHNQTLIACVF